MITWLSTRGHNWVQMYSRECSQADMSALLSEVTSQWVRETIKVPVQSAILRCSPIKGKCSCETQNHTGLIDFHYHSWWLLRKNTHTCQLHARTLCGTVRLHQLISAKHTIAVILVYLDLRSYFIFVISPSRSCWLTNDDHAETHYRRGIHIGININP